MLQAERSSATIDCQVRDSATRGTTRLQPLTVFLDEERETLAGCDDEPYKITHWRAVMVHPDHHVSCRYALYPVPGYLRPPGQQVEVGLGTKLVRIYHPSSGSGRQAVQDPRSPAS